MGEKEKREGVLQQHYKRAEDMRSGRICRSVQNGCDGF